MRELPQEMLDAFTGSSAGDVTLQFNVWYDGSLIEQDLNVGAWSISWDRSRQVICQTQATILDEDGSLTPWSIEDALGTGGSILQTKIVGGGTSANVAWQRIAEAEPEETWRILGGTTVWIPGGASIPINAEDITEDVIAYRFMAPEQPKAGNTCIQEIQRLLAGLMDVRVDSDVADKSVPTSIVYKEERMDAVEDLVVALGAEWRTTGDGQFHVHNPSTTSVWTTRGGMEGELISVKRKMTLASQYNGFVARNTAADGRELQGIAREETGAARWGGPMGHRVMFHAASFATTQQQIDQTAASIRDSRRSKATATLPVRTILNPAIEINDWITVMMPLPNGEEHPIMGKVLTIEWSGNGTVPVGMDLTLECSAQDIRDASDKVRRNRWLAR